MKKSIDNRFKELQNQFDINEPQIGHFERFSTRLSQNKESKFNFWKPLAIAASLLLLISFGWPYVFTNSLDLKDVSPKMAETQSYFVSVISQELKKINGLETANNKKVIKDALAQINILENDYKKLSIQLKESDENNRIINAMIDNYQKRIAILKSVLKRINNIKETKKISHEKITI